MVGISPYVEHSQKLVTSWMSIHQNWLLGCWACAKIGFLLAEHPEKSFWCTTCIFWVFSLLSPVTHSSISPWLMYMSLSHVLRPLSLGSVPCLLFCPWTCPHGYPPCPPSSVPCLLPPFLWLYFTVCVLCSSVSRPLFLHICPLPLVFHTCENASGKENI
jgi:hypothetical protein